MKKIVFSLVLALTFNFSSIAQEIALGNYDVYISYLKGEYRKTAIPELIVGTPYLDENFKLGAISFEGKEPLTASVRYNIVNEEFEVKLEDKIFYVQDKVEVRLEEGYFKKYQYQSDRNETLSGYFKIHNKESEKTKLVLLEKYFKKKQEGQEAAPMKPRSPAKYIDQTEFFLKFPGTNIAVPAEGKTKKFLEAFPVEHQDKIAKFIKDNNFKTNKKQNLVSIINYYNGL